MAVSALLWTFLTVSSSLLITPFLMFLLSIIFLASIGKSLGVRRLYVKILLQIFEYGRQHIEIAQKGRHVSRDSCCVDDAPHADTNSNDLDKAKRRAVANGGPPVANGNTVISREDLILVPDAEMNLHSNQDQEEAEVSKGLPRRPSFETFKREFKLADNLDYIKAGVEAIIEDQVTHRFEAEELRSWNLLTRTNHHYEFVSMRLTVIWVLGFFMRYFFLLPLRVLICFVGVMWLTVCTGVVGYMREGPMKRRINRVVSLMCFGVLSSALSSVVTYHHPENRPQRGICVANHTSPIDVLMLACDNLYTLIGQRHGGFLGILQRALARASPQIWFERSEIKDREAVARRLKQHVSNPDNPPILIFPEGTCINNTSVMQFKKGSFEVGGVIYPVAIKYDPKFGDAFWNSSRYSMLQYLYMMMSSWAIVCDVWYLPPMYQQEGESAIAFANRVKGAIARQGGLVDLMWDGQLKRMKPKKELKEKQQEEFSKRLKLE